MGKTDHMCVPRTDGYCCLTLSLGGPQQPLDRRQSVGVGLGPLPLPLELAPQRLQTAFYLGALCLRLRTGRTRVKRESGPRSENEHGTSSSALPRLNHVLTHLAIFLRRFGLRLVRLSLYRCPFKPKSGDLLLGRVPADRSPTNEDTCPLPP